MPNPERRKTPPDAALVEFLLDQLHGIPGLRAKAMFGGHGLYAGDSFFAIVFRGEFYFKVDDTTRPRYEAWGMGPFSPGEGRPMAAYYAVPPNAIDNSDLLTELAAEAVAVARRAPQKKRK